MSHVDLVSSPFAMPWLPVKCGTINGTIPLFQQSFEGSFEEFAGPNTNTGLRTFAYAGRSTTGAPTSIQAWIKSAGLGTRKVSIKSLNFATVYYETAGLTSSSPEGMYSLTKLTDLPLTATALAIVLDNDNTGNTTINGLNITY